MTQVIDAHQHFWDRGRRDFDHSWQEGPSREVLARNWLPADLEPLIRQAGVDRTVFVQTQHNVEENCWVLDLVAEHQLVAGVVGWVDLASDQCEAQLLEFNDHPKFVGIRHVTHDEPDDDFIVRPDIIRGLKVLEKHAVPFDLLFFAKHLPHAATLAQQLPDLPMVIDHLAKPEIKIGKMKPWRSDLRAAAEFPNIYCKLSGMITEADQQNWRPEDLRPYVDTVVEAFGPERCMFGTDWPVCLLAGSYQQVVDGLREALGPLSEHEAAAIWGGTATRFYGLDGD